MNFGEKVRPATVGVLVSGFVVSAAALCYEQVLVSTFDLAAQLTIVAAPFLTPLGLIFGAWVTQGNRRVELPRGYAIVVLILCAFWALLITWRVVFEVYAVWRQITQNLDTPTDTVRAMDAFIENGLGRLQFVVVTALGALFGFSAPKADAPKGGPAPAASGS